MGKAQNHSLQVFDLKAKKFKNFEIFDASAILEDFGNAHNIWINEASSFVMLWDQIYMQGVQFIDIGDPKNPKILGGYSRRDTLRRTCCKLYRSRPRISRKRIFLVVIVMEEKIIDCYFRCY